MKAMIFAAGLGTRLRPLTNDKPKALVELAGVPLMQRVAQKLIESGVDELVVNVHHFANKVLEHLAECNNYGIKVQVSDESEMLLETGGGLKKAAKLLTGNGPFFVHNADVHSDIGLQEMYSQHLASGALATLAVRKRDTSRYLLFDERGVLCGWENVKTNEVRLVRPPHSSQSKQAANSAENIAGMPAHGLQRWAFSGIHVISPEIFPLIKQEGKFSIIETYLDLAVKHEIRAFSHDEGVWIDCGKPEQLREAASFFK